MFGLACRVLGVYSMFIEAPPIVLRSQHKSTATVQYLFLDWISTRIHQIFPISMQMQTGDFFWGPAGAAISDTTRYWDCTRAVG